MLQDLLARAQEQAEHSSPPVRAAALLRIARVQAASDPGQGRRTFLAALDETRRIPGRNGHFMLEQARLTAAAVAPDLLLEIPATSHAHQQFVSEQIGRIMLEHKHFDAAFEYLMRYPEPSTFPFSVVPMLMQQLGDNSARRLAIFRRAIEANRKPPRQYPHQDHVFLWLFASHWKELPTGEARAVVREIVYARLEHPDQPINATYDEARSIEITSYRQHTFFQLLHIFRQLDNSLAESLIASHEQLAAAVRRFPNGTESAKAELEKRSTETTGEGRGFGYVGSGNPRDFPYALALMQATSDGDFETPITHALEKYQDDTDPDNPNLVPKEFWPSTGSFRQILYAAGKQLGEDATRYLDRIADRDLRLFAQIELIAAIAGLPELTGVQRQSRRPRPR